jgi:hypothetical protein
MFHDEAYRAFLLKTADAQTEAAVEEGILDHSVDLTYLRQVEEELIDDFLFDCLSKQETEHFNEEFLSTEERRKKLNFAFELQRYAKRQSLSRLGSVARRSLKGFRASPWHFALTSALACALLATGWLTERNLSLRHELFQSTQENGERRQTIARSQPEQKRTEYKSGISPPSIAQTPPSSGALEASGPSIRLSSVRRNLAAIPVIHLAKRPTMVNIRLELPFDFKTELEEELLNSTNRVLWSQHFFGAGPIEAGRTTTITLPAALLDNDDYRLRVNSFSGGGEPVDRTTYLFRVRRD